MKVYLEGNFTATTELGISVTKKRHGVVSDLARKLLDAGEEKSEILEIYRGSTKCFEDQTIEQWASRCLYEHDHKGFYTQKYKEREWEPWVKS